MKSYRAGDVMRLTGVTYRQLEYWTALGLVDSITGRGAGSGNYRAYSHSDVGTVRAIKRLLDSGVSLARIRRDGDPRLTVLNLLIELSKPEEAVA